MSAAELHPDLRKAARFMPRPFVGAKTLPVIRLLERLWRRQPTPPGVEVLTTSDGIGIRLHRPPRPTGPGPALLWIHGGGYVTGAPQQDDQVCRRFAEQLGVTVAAVDYRLAPESPYPAALDDCYAALTWLTRLPGVDPARVAIAGASSGGGLAAALAFVARDRGEVDLLKQILVYPMLDDRSHHSARRPDSQYRVWNGRNNEFAWRSYLGAADPEIAVPARRTDLAGLPPAWIGVGSLDLFHDEDLAYAERLRAAGVPCEVEVVPGAFHGFDQVAATAAVARAFFDSQVVSLRAAYTG